MNAPEVNPQLVIATGASELRSTFTSDVLPGVVQAYMDGLKAVFAVGVGLVGVAFLASFLVPWKRLFGKPGEPMAVA